MFRVWLENQHNNSLFLVFFDHPIGIELCCLLGVLCRTSRIAGLMNIDMLEFPGPMIAGGETCRMYPPHAPGTFRNSLEMGNPVTKGSVLCLCYF